MLKVVVFDSGWGGEMFADYLESELSIIDVIRVIDWRGAPYCEKTPIGVRLLVEEAIKPYVGRVDLVVLASNLASAVCLDYLRGKYPEQKFLGFEMALPRGLNSQKMLILGTGMARRSPKYEQEKARLKAEIMEIDCDALVRKIDDGDLGEGEIREVLAPAKDFMPDTVLLNCTHLADIKRQIVKILGWQTSVVDDFGVNFRRVCRELKLKGVDGKRNKS